MPLFKHKQFRASPVASDSRGIGLRCLPSTTWSADDKEVVEDVPTFIATKLCNGERYETEISHTDRYGNDIGFLELVSKRLHA